MAQRRTISKNELELRQDRYNLIRTVVPWVGWVSLVAVSWLPLQAIIAVAHELAGKTTEFSGTLTTTVTVSVAVNIVLGGAFFTERRRRKRHERELERVRARLSGFEEVKMGEVGMVRREKGAG